MRRSSSKISSPLGALALFFLLVCSSSFHCAAAGRLLQPAAAVPLLIAHHHETNNGAKAAAAADGLVVLQSAAVVSGDELSVSSEVLGAEAEDEEGAVVCEETGNEDECLQRRLLFQNAHLDYIYTQHKGKP